MRTGCQCKTGDMREGERGRCKTGDMREGGGVGVKQGT